MLQLCSFRLRKFLFVILLIGCVIQKSDGQTVTIPNIIGSNMVLQQNTQVPLWGWATEGTSIEINASWGQTVTAVAGANGKWMTKIQTPVAVSGLAPVYSITIAGPVNSISFTNILVGEVWLCSGQSNMWFPMNYAGTGMQGVVDYATEIAAANYPNIRLFTVPLADSTTPKTNCNGSWLSCSPTTVSAFSAVAYYFGRELYNNKAVNVPIGLINDSYWSTSIQAWIKDSVLRADATLKTKYIDPAFVNLYSAPSLVYNAMISPIIPFAIKGVIWYQGESNVGDGAIYTKANHALVKDWRAQWGIDFPFYAVQIAPRFNVIGQKDLSHERAFFREAQSNIMTDSKMGIIVTNDLLLDESERNTSHPRNKKDVGIRLSLWALAKNYGQPLQYLGPMYQSYSVEGNKIRITFKPESLGSGLATRDGLQIKNFRIAGTDKLNFYPALAVIEGNTIVVSSTYVTSPTSVRYAFTDGAMTNLMNKEGIAAYPFRTDAWNEYPSVYVDMPEPSTDIKNMQLESIEIFPNPFHDNFTISGINNEVVKIEIFDIMGRKVKSQMGDDISKIDVSDIVEGAYVLKISKKDKTTIDLKAIKH